MSLAGRGMGLRSNAERKRPGLSGATSPAPDRVVWPRPNTSRYPAFATLYLYLADARAELNFKITKTNVFNAHSHEVLKQDIYCRFQTDHLACRDACRKIPFASKDQGEKDGWHAAH